jgi:ribosomal-protein-alanine N-acetyltransferase
MNATQAAPTLSPPTVALARAGLRDLMATHELEKVCFGRDAWGYFELIYTLVVPGHILIKAVAGSTMVGLVIGEPRPFEGVGWIASICVHPDYQRRGIGKLLLAACENALPQRLIKLTVRKSNHTAIALYKQFGYEQVTVWQNYYNGGEDGFVMGKAKTP